MNEDITFCANRKCNCHKCARHPNKVKLPIPHSFADLENTQYCKKTRKEACENENKIN